MATYIILYIPRYWITYIIGHSSIVNYSTYMSGFKMGMFRLLMKIGKVMIARDGEGQRYTILGIITELLAVCVAVASPFGLGMAVDALSAENPNIHVVIIGIGSFIVFWVFAAVLQAIKMTFTTKLCNVVARLILTKSLCERLPIVAMERDDDTGQFQGVFERLPYSLQTIVEGLLWNIFPLALQVIITIGVVAAAVSWKYALLMMLILGVHAAVSYRASEKYERQANSANIAAAFLSGSLSDLLRNAQRAIFNGEGANEIQRVSQAASNKANVDVRMSILLVKACIWQFGVMGSGIALLLVLGAFDVISGMITTGDFVMLQAYVLSFASPIASYGYVFRQAGVAAANISDALAYMPSATKSSTGAVELMKNADPAVVIVDNLHYTYGAHADINGINLRIPAGSFTVIVGPNGSGKSTLARLLAGLLIPAKGIIKIGEQLSTVACEIHKRNILYVPQHVSLFNRSLLENGLYPPTTLEEKGLKALLKSLSFYEGEHEIELGLCVGERGGRLSGGQIQKLELVRVSQSDIPVIILDETTSALDVRSEECAIDLLKKSRRDKSTLIMISHRIYAAENADVVVFMKAGKIASIGLHSAMMQDNVEYREFWAKRESEIEES